MTLTAEDRCEIQRLLARFVLAQDTRSPAVLESFIAEDAEFRLGRLGSLKGRDDIVWFFGQALLSFDYTQHSLSTCLIEEDGDDATARTYFLARHIRRSVPDGDTFSVGGLYEDRFRRTATGWSLVSRSIEAGWTEGNSAVMSEMRPVAEVLGARPA